MKSANNIEQKSSTLLTKEENEQIFKLLGHKCETLATTVVQLFATDGPESVHWVKKDIGILCLVRDPNRRSYFFRLFCLVRKKMVWEHEIYNDMQYLAPRSFLHTFEAEERIVAFNFANENEAAHMRGILLEKLKKKEQKRMERKNREQENSRNRTPARPAPTPNLNTMSNGYVTAKHKSMKSSNSGKKFKKKSITKDDIGCPLNFQHISHVGFDKDMGFKMENVDSTMLQFFKKAGISENDLKDKETMEYIYDFIERHGGYDAVKENIQQSVPPPPSPPPPPPVPIRNVPPPPSASVRVAPRPPSSTLHRAMHPAPPPPPTSPPPLNVVIQRTQEQIRRSDVTTVSSAPGSIPPPPPPPLPPPEPLEDNTCSELNISCENTFTRNSTLDSRTALMEAIRSGTTLKHVEVESKKSGADNCRGELLNQIRQGIELKSVPQINKSSQNNAFANNDLASALARALAERAKHMHSDSSPSSDDDDSDNEWDD
ncbi:hypothetical protein PGB90_004322 [Kerria lacca]